ncbi:MAG TPA: NUDIX domain-containing protein [Intrasporangium sp.]|uniref:NUDIX domain-containing protein n=1 Tax=Intrasporangium sp. TaxID=1925024 RepID=UPI002B473E35|nr:NUDIX domain-containing protein [Intrasporangium sp.]HKX66589.1 NUDIX domain-containing protein [Intrasporangium sp.]
MDVAEGDSGEPEVTHRVVSGVLTQAGRVLMCHRRADRAWYPDVWDFPGGHLEDGETPQAALRRELREELGIQSEGEGTFVARFVAEDLSEDITFLHLRDWRGDPVNLAPDEHDDLAWFTLAEALSLELPDPRYEPLLRGVLSPASRQTDVEN